MSLLNKTSAAEHPSREAVSDHVDEAKHNPELHHEAMESAQKASTRMKRNEAEGGGIFTK